MRTHTHKTAQLGELVVAVYDEAGHYSTDPREVSRLATRAISHMVRRGRRLLDARKRVLSRVLRDS